MAVWEVSFDSGEHSVWTFVFGSRKEAREQARNLEVDGWEHGEGNYFELGEAPPKYIIRKTDSFYHGA